MATIITREVGATAKGSPLTNAEIDNNLINLNADIATRVSSSEKGSVNGVATLDGAGKVVSTQLPNLDYVPNAQKGAVNGVATLDDAGKVPAIQLPSYVDDVQEAANLAAFPATGETGKIYVALDTNKTYRWSGSAYIFITSGAVDSVAGKTGVVTLVKGDIGLANVDNTSDADKPVSTAQQTALNAKQVTLLSGTNIKTVNGNSILGSGNIQIDGGVTSFNTRTGAITLSSGDVTGALGFTPYNSSNPSGYITSSALSSYLPLSGGTVSYLGINNASAINLKGAGAGTYNTSWIYSDTTVNSWEAPKTTDSSAGAKVPFILTWRGGYASEGGLRLTGGSSGELGGNTILHAGNYTSYAPSLTGGGASGTWGINITGSSASTTGNAATATNISNTGTVTLASATESNWIYITSPSYTTGAPVKLLNFDWYGNTWSIGNIRSGGTPSDGFGVYFQGSERGRWSSNGFGFQVGTALGYDNPGGWGANLVAAGTNHARMRLRATSFNSSGDRETYLWLDNTVSPATGLFSSAGTFNFNGSIGTVQVAGNTVLHAGNYTSYSSFSGAVTSGGNNGFRNDVYYGAVRNPIWSFGDATSYGISYFQGSAGIGGTDTIGIHPNGTATSGGSAFSVTPSASYVNSNVVLHAGNYTSYSPSLGGSGASGTWGINVTGSAGSVAWGNVSSRPSSIMYYQGFTLDANTMDSNATGFTYSNNAPYTGPIARFSTGGGYDLWLNSSYGNGNTLAFRTRQGDAGTLNAWRHLVSYGVNYGDSLYGTIVYDANDTGYYVDPNSTSNLGGLTLACNVATNRSAHGRANANLVLLADSTYGAACIDFRSGVNYPSDGAQIYYETATNGSSGETSRLVIRTENDADDSILLRGGFIQYQSITVDGGSSNPGHRFTYNSTDRMYVYSDNTTETGSFRAPIFYDSNDTGYYLDPNSTSRMQQINFNNLYYAPDTNYGFLGSSIYVDTINSGYASDQLEINYVRGTWAGISHDSLRAPLYYDYDNTGYYVNPDSTSSLYRVDINNNVYFTNYGRGMVGTYSASRYQAVFAMGDSYKLPDDGTSTGSLYGIAWSHPNAGGTAGNLNTHGALILENGGFLAALSGSIRSRDDMRTPIFYDSNNTGYYVDPDSTSYLYNLTLAGGGYFQPNNWIQLNGSYGLYWPNHYGAHLHANDLSTYTQIAIRGGKNSYGGIYDQYSGVNIGMYDSSGNGGLFREGSGRWYQYYHVGNDCTGFGTSSTDSAYNIYAPKGIYSGGRVDGTIFYDSNDTSYYLDPASGGVSLRIGGAIQGNHTGWTGEMNKIQWHSGHMYFQNTSDGLWIFRNSNGAEPYVLNANGSGTASGSWRAPIFYDSNDTAFYLDPNTTGTSLNVAGAIVAGGNITAFSDETLKADWTNLPSNYVEQLANLLSGTFTRKDTGQRQAGVGAQSLQKFLPEVVVGDTTLSVAYGNAALVSAVELAKRVVEQDNRIAKLEALVAQLLAK
jgi:hypothetical protein